jgi:hypothetical protein
VYMSDIAGIAGLILARVAAPSPPGPPRAHLARAARLPLAQVSACRHLACRLSVPRRVAYATP